MNDRGQNQGKNFDGRHRPGPRTPGGKERSRLNAVKTGIFAKVLATAKPFSEQRNFFDKLLRDLQDSIRPGDNFEEILVENLAVQFWRLGRVYQADAEVAPLLFRRIRETLEADKADAKIAGLLNEESGNPVKLPSAELLMRYESGIWRQIDRIIERISHWRRLRNEDSTPQSAESEDDVAEPDLGERPA